MLNKAFPLGLLHKKLLCTPLSPNAFGPECLKASQAAFFRCCCRCVRSSSKPLGVPVSLPLALNTVTLCCFFSNCTTTILGAAPLPFCMLLVLTHTAEVSSWSVNSSFTFSFRILGISSSSYSKFLTAPSSRLPHQPDPYYATDFILVILVMQSFLCYRCYPCYAILVMLQMLVFFFFQLIVSKTASIFLSLAAAC